MWYVGINKVYVGRLSHLNVWHVRMISSNYIKVKHCVCMLRWCWFNASIFWSIARVTCVLNAMTCWLNNMHQVGIMVMVMGGLYTPLLSWNFGIDKLFESNFKAVMAFPTLVRPGIIWLIFPWVYKMSLNLRRRQWPRLNSNTVLGLNQ